MAIEKRGDLANVSTSFEGLVDRYKSYADTGFNVVLEKVLEKTVAEVIERIFGKGPPDAIDIKYLTFVLKFYAPDIFEKTSAEVIQRAATRYAKKTSDGANLFAFCELNQLDVRKSGIRIVDKDHTFTIASLYYDWKGSLFEAYHGHLYSDINRRRHFVVYVPSKKVPVIPNWKLTVRASEYRA